MIDDEASAEAFTEIKGHPDTNLGEVEETRNLRGVKRPEENRSKLAKSTKFV